MVSRPNRATNPFIISSQKRVPLRQAAVPAYHFHHRPVGRARASQGRRATGDLPHLPERQSITHDATARPRLGPVGPGMLPQSGGFRPVKVICTSASTWEALQTGMVTSMKASSMQNGWSQGGSQLTLHLPASPAAWIAWTSEASAGTPRGFAEYGTSQRTESAS